MSTTGGGTTLARDERAAPVPALADYGAFAPGVYPRSEALVAVGRDFVRGRASREAVERQRALDRQRLLELQRENGLAPQTDGFLDRPDLFRPLVEATDGLSPGALVRFLDTNTFHRAVVVEATPRLRAPLAPPPLPAGWLGTLPSPFALACATGDAVGAAALAESVLAPQIEAWAVAGCALVVLAEPFLPGRPHRVGELVTALGRLPRPVPVAVQLTFGDGTPLVESLADAELDAIGIDFRATPLDALPVGCVKPILAGVVDSASSLLEEPHELAAFARTVRARVAAPVALTPNGDLEHVPERIAREKLRRLGAASALLRGTA